MSEVAPVGRRVADGLPVVDAETAAATIPAGATVAVSGFGSVGYPKAVPLALASDDRDLDLTLVSGGSVGDEIDDALLSAGQVSRRFAYQARPAARRRANRGEVAFHDRHVSSLGDEVGYGQLADPDVAVVEAVAVGDGWFVPSTSIGPVPRFVERADRLVVEVNEAQPLALQHLHDLTPLRSPLPASGRTGAEGAEGAEGADGAGGAAGADGVDGTVDGDGAARATVRFDPDSLDAVVHTDAPDAPYEFRALTETERGLGDVLVDFLSDALADEEAFGDPVVVQFGVGSVGNAMMAELDAIDVGDRELVYAGEVIQDGLLDAVESGLLAAASATSLALSREGQRRLFADVDRYADTVVLRPSDVSNDPSTISRLGTVAVNSAVEVDLYGHANSTHVAGSRLLNGIGGAADFVRNARLSVVALPSTAADGEVSRVVPMASHVDHTEHDVDVVVTEHGVADLRGLAPVERAERIVERCAHPEFRPALRAYRDRADARGGHLPHDLETAFDFHLERE
jgi:succinyl-CoA:acetate CoA-transferase